LAPCLRAADIDELRATCGLAPEAALARSLALSTHAWFAADATGAPLALWGVGPVSLIDGKGCPWLLASDAFDALPPRLVAGMSRKLLVDIVALYPRLENRVDARHEKALRWLAWLGFELAPAAPWGVEGRPFHRFSIDRENGANTAGPPKREKETGPARLAPWGRRDPTRVRGGEVGEWG
jgi:hypothetical protein